MNCLKSVLTILKLKEKIANVILKSSLNKNHFKNLVLRKHLEKNCEQRLLNERKPFPNNITFYKNDSHKHLSYLYTYLQYECVFVRKENFIW